MAAARAPDLVVLDLMLPARRWPRGDAPHPRARRPRRTAIILLTARGEESDRIVGLRLGADDYIVKPFSPAELVARVDAVLRRHRHRPASRSRRCASTGSSWIRADGACALDGEEVVAHPARVRAAAVPRPPPGPGVHAQPAHGPRVAATRSTPTPRRSPFTSGGCGPSSRRPRSARAGSRRCGASATASQREALPGSLGFAIATAGAGGGGGARRLRHEAALATLKILRAAGGAPRCSSPTRWPAPGAASAACAASSRSSPWSRWCSSRPRSCSSSTQMFVSRHDAFFAVLAAAYATALDRLGGAPARAPRPRRRRRGARRR